jgi:hypothetical protein
VEVTLAKNMDNSDYTIVATISTVSDIFAIVTGKGPGVFTVGAWDVSAGRKDLTGALIDVNIIVMGRVAPDTWDVAI